MGLFILQGGVVDRHLISCLEQRDLSTKPTNNKMVSGTLYTYPGNYRAQKIQIAAAYSGADVKVASNFEFGQTNTSDEFLAKFPMGKVPAFEDSNGVCLSETNAIAHFVANETLRGTNPIDQALVMQYLEFADNEVLPSACTWVYPTLGFKQYNKQDTEKAQTHLKKCLALLNGFLETRTFLVGERVTLADIALACNMMMLYAQVLDPKFREPFGNVNRWFLTCINQPKFKSVLGEFSLCEKMATFDNKRYQELHPKDNKKAKDPKPKQEKKPKEEKKEEAKPCAPVAVEKPKKKDHFADCCETESNMETWKRFYSNNDSSKFLPYIWENFDAAGWSWWHADYKYNEENKVAFMTMNLIGGMYQRLDGCRKHCFGVNLMIKDKICCKDTGVEKDVFKVEGVWLMRGHKQIFEMGEEDGWNYDAENFHFRKLDPLNNADDKVLIESILDWEGPYLVGKEIEDGMSFK